MEFLEVALRFDLASQQEKQPQNCRAILYMLQYITNDVCNNVAKTNCPSPQNITFTRRQLSIDCNLFAMF